MNNMETSERIVFALKDVIVDRPIYLVSGKGNLYFTDKRMAFVCLGSSYDKILANAAGLLAGYVISEMARASRTSDKKKDENVQGVLDEMLKEDKKSFALDYKTIDTVKLSKNVFGKFGMEVRFTDSMERIVDVTLTEEQCRQTNTVLPTIEGVKEKFKSKLSFQPQDEPESDFAKAFRERRNDKGS
jgi:hypothetical protein